MGDIGAWILVVVLSAGMIVGWLMYRRNHPARGKWSWKQFFAFCALIAAVTALRAYGQYLFPGLADSDLQTAGMIIIVVFGVLIWKSRKPLKWIRS